MTRQLKSEPGGHTKFRYLSTKVEVAQQNCCLRAGDEQNDENQEQESKHVVHLMRPETNNILMDIWKIVAQKQNPEREFLFLYQMLLRMKKS